jgi:hypothetical protein
MDKTLFYGGFRYRLNREYTGTGYYICSASRSTRCNARLIRKDDNVVATTGTHTCSKQLVQQEGIVDSTAFVNQRLPDLAADHRLTALEIYSRILVELHEQYTEPIVNIPKKVDIRRMVRELRGVSRTDWLENIWSHESSMLEGMRFLRTHWRGVINQEEQQILLWMTNEGVALLRAGGPVLVDGTFKACPHEFHQLVIVMTYDKGTSCYVPCAYSLLTSKNEWMYLRLFHEILMQLDYVWEPESIVCDFELGLINAIKQEFPTSTLTGCYFHWKQALHRKLVKRGFRAEERAVVISSIEFLVAIEPEMVLSGLAYAKRSLPDTPKYQLFLEYFANTWIKKYDPVIWTQVNQKKKVLIRTNNGLERYNRRLNEKFSSAHPSMPTFIQVIREETLYYSLYLTNIRRGVEPFPQHQEFELPKVPDDFMTFQNNCDK